MLSRTEWRLPGHCEYPPREVGPEGAEIPTGMKFGGVAVDHGDLAESGARV